MTYSIFEIWINDVKYIGISESKGYNMVCVTNLAASQDLALPLEIKLLYVRRKETVELYWYLKMKLYLN